MLTPPRAWPPLPAWVDPQLELVDTSDVDTTPERFVRDALALLLALGCPRERAVEVIAHCATECSWGRRAVGHNSGGIKLTQTDVRRAVRAGHPLGWYRAPGHAASGDADVVYYRTFADDPAFWAYWLGRYTPRSAAVALRDARYVETGQVFWSGGDWFTAMLQAGYRGPVRQRELAALVAAGRDPATHPSVVEHRAVVARVRRLLAGSP